MVTIIPQQRGVQAWDRYAYTNNNPVRYTDPSGKGVDCGMGDSSGCRQRVGKEQVGKVSNPISVSTPTPTPPSNQSSDDGPITSTILSIPGDAGLWEGVSTGFDIIAKAIDTYAAGVVTYGGIAGAGIASPFIAGGAPEVPVMTGLGGIAIAELAVQPLIMASNGLAALSTASTIIADTKSGTTNIDELVFSPTTLNSITLTTAGFLIPEAYLSLVMQTLAVTNDFGVTSFPWSGSLPWRTP